MARDERRFPNGGKASLSQLLMITIFTPTFADEQNTNAQHLTVKEIVSRLPPDRFRVLLLGDGVPDPRIAARPNTQIWPCYPHGNTAQWLYRLIRARVDLYFFPRVGPLDAVFLFLRRWLRLPVAVVTYIVMALDEIAIGSTMTSSICEAEEVVGNSQFVSRTVADRFGIQAATIHDGIRRDLFYPRPEFRLDARKLNVLYAGSFQARKRVELVIREAEKRPAVNFRLAGIGEEENKCRSLASKLDCRNVTFLGHLSQPDLAEEMRNADLFLFPSVLEGHPQVLGQAAACGLPAVAMQKYQPDYVVDGETGCLVKSESELSQRVGWLLGDPSLRLKMSAAAVRHASKFDWDEITRLWEGVFAEAIGRRRTRV